MGDRSTDLDIGSHICSIYRNDDELFSPVLPFLKHGSAKNQKCLYIADEHTNEEISSKIECPGLQILRAGDTYLQGGFFEPDKMITFITATVHGFARQGFSGVRAAAEMTWMLNGATTVEKLISYESKLNEIFPKLPFAAVCQYNEMKFSKDILIDIIRTHPLIMLHGKLYENKYFYTAPEYSANLLKRFKSEDYDTILSIIEEDKPDDARKVLN